MNDDTITLLIAGVIIIIGIIAVVEEIIRNKLKK